MKSMKKFVYSALFLLIFFKFYSQPLAYKVEDKGYFNKAIETKAGLLLIGHRQNDLYILKNGKLNLILSAPGCARYVYLSPDSLWLGFKYIHKDGFQQPAMVNLWTGEITFLYPKVNLCGQPTFDSHGNIYFTIDNELLVYHDSIIRRISLPLYVNYIAVSHNGKYIAFADDDKGIYLLDLEKKTFTLLGTPACFYPKFSFDDRFLAYGANPNLLYVYDLLSGETKGPVEMAGFSWHPFQHKLVGIHSETKNFEIIRSDVWELSVPNMQINKITSSPALEHSVSYDGKGNYLITYLTDYTVRKISVGSKGNRKYSFNVFHISNLEQSAIFPVCNTKADITVPGTVPYVHQVYDTPSWHSGYWSCAPSTSIMAIAYYNRLPKWPVSVNHGKPWDPHTNDYGSYVADRYRFNEYYYQDTAADYAGNTAYGGYGYMWMGSRSPSSYMKTYIQNHYLTSQQYWTTSCTFTATTTEIDNGYVHPICSYLTSAGHLVLAIGYKSGQHTLIFNDPYGNKNTPGYPSYDGAYSYYDWPGYNNGYQNLDADGSHGYVAWTVTARGTQPAYSDTIIDDNHFNHGFFMNNVNNGSHMRYFRDFNVGYGNHCWYTIGMASGSDVCFCTWTPTITNNGYYRVSAFIPPKGGNTAHAKYKIYHANGVDSVVVNQGTHRNQWVVLGTYYFTTSGQKYVYLGDVTGTNGDSVAFDCVKFSPVQIDNVAPTTSISTTGTWKTQDFIANFNDSDNMGIENAFYQVLDFDGTYWGANANRGFFGDNFDILQPHWHISTGSWSVSNGELLQTDTTLGNTNIYAYLNQTLSNRYLYHFVIKYESSSDPRFGFHLFSDSASLTNRNNSYFIWFRISSNALEFYKVVNDVFTKVYSVNNVVLNPNTWYDVKVTYDRVLGKISVWVNNEFKSWVDTSPLDMNKGKYISFRTGNCKIHVTELKVYRSRYPQVTITLGDSSKDIRYQNPDSATCSAKIKSIVVDVNNNLSAIAYHDLNVDWTPPQFNYVWDGFSSDVDTLYDDQVLSARWSTVNPNSGVAEYWFALGTSAGDSDVIGWTSVGTNTQVSFSLPPLTYGQRYYVSIRAKNNAGLMSMSSSDGFVYWTMNVPVAKFHVEEDTLCLPGEALFVNESEHATMYEWDFGDGTTSTDENPIHVYGVVGSYTVRLIAKDPPLPADTFEVVNAVTVRTCTGMEEVRGWMRVYPQPFVEELNISFGEPFSGHVKLLDEVGREVISRRVEHAEKVRLSELAKLAVGQYMLEVYSDNGSIQVNIIVQKTR